MITVNLLSQRICEVHFTNRMDKSGKIKLKNGFNFRVNYNKENTRCEAILYQSAQMEEAPDKLFVSGEIRGVFQLEGVVDEETKRKAHIECYNMLFPYLQSTVTQLAAASGMAGFMLKKNNMNPENVIFSAKQKPPEDPPMTLPIV